MLYTKKAVKVIGLFISHLTLLFVMAQIASAAIEPSFSACVNPQGSVVANYSSGTHGIVGSSNTYVGSDTVYQSTESTFVQCFCPENTGEGIQTNWWNAKDLNDEEIQYYKNIGWYFVPSGNAWGLNEDPYLAKNNTYTCRSNNGGSTSSSSNSSNSSSGVGGVLALANTGNASFLYINAILAISFVALGLYLLKKS